jgi:hypothetical protein
MNDIFQDAPISISIIDYLGKIENGVGLLLSLVAGDESYELGYWFNKDGHFRIVAESKLLQKLGVNDIYEFEYINEFIYFIHNSLPDPDKILNEFIK